MHRAASFFLFGLLALTSTSSLAQRDCDGCSIVEEYGIQGIRAGSTYRNFDGNPITVVQIDYSTRKALVYAAGYPNARRSWIPAENIYTDQRVFERQQKAGFIASCAAYRAALDEGSFLGTFLMRGACCQSSAARRYGPPRDIC